MNKVVLIGRLTKNPELRKTQSGTSVTSFTLAVAKDKEKTDWIPCVAYASTADLINKYLKKGSKVAVDGKVNTRNYENDKGNKVYVVEVLVNSIEFVESKRADSNDDYTSEMTDSYESPALEITNDDLPF